MVDIDNDMPVPEPHAQNGRRLVTDQERIDNQRTYQRQHMAEKRKNPELYAAMKEYQKTKYHANLEESRAYVKNQAKKYRIRDKEKVNAHATMYRRRRGKEWVKDKDLISKYGITLQEWNALFDRQDKCCAICRCGDSSRWHTDHNHTSGKVRGILCSNCNSGIGMFRENAMAMFNAIEYLKRN